jgi:hypothetical protein
MNPPCRECRYRSRDKNFHPCKHCEQAFRYDIYLRGLDREIISEAEINIDPSWLGNGGGKAVVHPPGVVKEIIKLRKAGLSTKKIAKRIAASPGYTISPRAVRVAIEQSIGFVSMKSRTKQPPFEFPDADNLRLIELFRGGLSIFRVFLAARGEGIHIRDKKDVYDFFRRHPTFSKGLKTRKRKDKDNDNDKDKE